MRTKKIGEYDAETDSWLSVSPRFRDDKDFDEIDNGYDVETTIVLRREQALTM